MENSKNSLSYANIAVVSHSNNDFIVEYGESVPIVTDWSKVTIKNEMLSIIRIAQSPKHFKKLVNVMVSELANYEAKFGEIKLDE
jgi:hypothetical protein